MLRVLVAVSVLFAAGCGGSVGHENPATDGLPIYGGSASGPEDDFVVRLEALNSLGLKVDCSGTLVAPRLVLTARHCLVNFVPPPMQCDANGELMSPGDGGKFGNAHDPTKISVFFGPGFPLDVVAHGTQIFSVDTPSVCRDDVGLLVIDQPLAAPVIPLRLFQPVSVGEPVSVIGYGFGEGDGKVFRKKVSGLPVQSVGPDQVDPADDSQTPPRSFVLGRSSCPGDSGGPVVSDQSGAIIGVTSWRNDGCDLEDVRNFFPRIGPHSDVVSEAFAAIGAEPMIEGVSETPKSEPESSAAGCAVSTTRARLNPLLGLCLLLLLRMRERRASRARRAAR